MNLPFVEFYITNVCNLACSNCNRFNNENTTGYVRFNKELYKPWADLYDIDLIGIIGGEPTLHPYLGEWCSGIRDLWPDSNIVLTSNGTNILKCKNLFAICSENNVTFEISFHDETIDQQIKQDIETFTQLHGTNWTPRITEDWDMLMSDEGFSFYYTQAHHFYNNQIANWDLNNKPEPFNSNPDKAHANCGMKHSHTFYNGKLHKCGFIPSVDAFLNLHKAHDNYPKINGYQPHIVGDDLSRLTQPEDICSYCPERYKVSKVITGFKSEKV